MEIIKKGAVDLKEMSALSCCWPPGTETMQTPEEVE